MSDTVTEIDNDLLDLILNDPIARIEGLLSVPSPDQQIVPFKLTRIQRHFLESVAEWQASGRIGARRRITVKPRQVKMSSVIMARNYTDTMLNPNFNCLVMCQDDDTKSTFRDRARRHLEDLRKVGLAPEVTTDNTYEMEFGRINSRIVFRTATEAGGRAYTFHRAHLSEFAFYEDASKVLTAVLPSLSGAGAEIDVESTSNGPSGTFWDIATAVGEGREDWELVFYPWWWEESYVQNPDVYVTTDLSSVEEWLMATHGLNRAQIAFRRSVRRLWQTLGPDAPPVEREYAEDIDSAFAAGSDAVFDPEELGRVKTMLREPIRKEGDLWVWREPMPGAGYVIGADVAAGGATTDNSAAYVADKNGLQVAGWYGKLGAVEFAKVLNDLGHRYNTAYLVPEGWPGEGSITCALLQENYKYPKLHYSEQGSRPRPGFITSSSTRPELVKALLETIKYDQTWINDPRLYGELRALIWYTKKKRPGVLPKLQAGPGAHDDYVIAMALAHKYISMAIARADRRTLGQRARGWVGF